jgi:hypothetical protein
VEPFFSLHSFANVVLALSMIDDVAGERDSYWQPTRSTPTSATIRRPLYHHGRRDQQYRTVSIRLWYPVT